MPRNQLQGKLDLQIKKIESQRKRKVLLSGFVHLEAFAVIKTNPAGGLNIRAFPEGFISRAPSMVLVLLPEPSPPPVPCSWPLRSRSRGRRPREERNLGIFRVMLKGRMEEEPALNFRAVKARPASSFSPAGRSASQPGAPAGLCLTPLQPKFPQGQGSVATVPVAK